MWISAIWLKVGLWGPVPRRQLAPMALLGGRPLMSESKNMCCTKLAKYGRYRLVIPGRGRCSYTGLDSNRGRGKGFEMDQNPSLCHFNYM